MTARQLHSKALVSALLTQYVNAFHGSYDKAEQRAWMDAQEMIVYDEEITITSACLYLERYEERLAEVNQELEYEVQ